jgi:hypothetical protein
MGLFCFQKLILTLILMNYFNLSILKVKFDPYIEGFFLSDPLEMLVILFITPYVLV